MRSINYITKNRINTAEKEYFKQQSLIALRIFRRCAIVNSRSPNEGCILCTLWDSRKSSYISLTFE